MRDGFVERYRADTENVDVDGLPPGEGVFLPCSFWLVAVLAQQGRLDEAVELYERLLALGNDLGLIAEEYDPEQRRLVGNFPQAFTHLALVETAFTLEKRVDKAERPLLDRAGQEPLDEVALEGEEHDERDRERDEGGRRDDLEVRAELAQLREDRDRDRLRVAGEGQRDEQVVPDPEELEDRERRDRGQSERKDEPEEDPHLRGAVDPSRLQQVPAESR